MREEIVMNSSDLKQFWKDDEKAHQDNCFNPEAPQVAMGIRMSDECVYAELGEEGDVWGIEPRQRRIELNKRYNDKAELIVGKRLLQEEYPMEDENFPPIKRIGEVFGGKYEYIEGVGMWLSSPVKTIKELEKTLDKVDKMDLHSFLYSENWEAEKKRIFEAYGRKPELMRAVRGPVTLACSIYGEENLIFLYFDAKELYERFSDTIRRVIIKMAEIADGEAGFSKEDAPSGFAFYDDNCSLLNPDMYEVFGYSVLKGVFERFSPKEKDIRYQHSDSEMAHLLPILARLNFTGVNFGPTLTVDEIRDYMPNARIDGQLAPFTFMRNNKDEIIAEVKRDCERIKLSGTKGLNLTTAGSINNGSSLESMRVVMEAILTYGRY